MKIAYEKIYDIAVVGGGIAGVAAALQAARCGMKTILIEKTVLPGGLATTGLVRVYLPLCDGNGHQVSFGITEELLRASYKYGPGDIPENWKNGKNAPESGRFRALFSPASFILALDELLEDAGVDIWYDTLVCDAEVENNRITAIHCENTSGRGRILAKQFIDASGDCTVARRAGVPCHDEYNFLSLWALQYDKNIKREDDFGPGVSVYVAGVPWDPAKAPEGTLFRGEDGRQVTDFMLKSRKLLREQCQRAYANEPENYNRNTYYPLKVPAMTQFRKIFSIDAEYIPGSDDHDKDFEDSIGIAGDWRRPGPVWVIPYRSLYPACHLGGLLAAGRCTGAKEDAWEITRVIPTAALTGQAAGLAAVLCIQNGVEPYELDVKLLQNELKNKYGFPLTLADVGLTPKA